MAIKILNLRHPDATKRVVCRNCSAELEYTLADTERQDTSDYTGGKDSYRILQCPVCSHKINLGNWY